MIIVPIVIGPGAVGEGSLPKLSRLDFPNLKPGDLVGVIRNDGDWIAGWAAYIYVIPPDDDVFYPISGNERYWPFENVRHATTKWGAKRHLRKMVRNYIHGTVKEIKEFPL